MLEGCPLFLEPPRSPVADEANPTDFLARYQRGDLNDFYALGPRDVDAALGLPRPQDRTRLADALRVYATRLGAPEAVFEALGRLEHPRSRAVVTGQQTGLLLGPTYTLSKAVTVVSLAKKLSTEDRPVVPVFWLASQDHDAAEIDHAYLLDLSESLVRLSVELPSEVPAGRIPFEAAWLETLTKGLRAVEAKEAYREEVLALLKESAAQAKTYADLFGALLYRLLGEQGLILIDPLEPETAPLFAPVLGAELRDPLRSSRAVNEAAERLRGLGVVPQLGRGENATNLFLAEADRRSLLRFDGSAFYTQSARYSREDLENILRTDPSRLTPAAGLRPVTQDAALPTAVMVVGPGELRYFAQLGGVYEAHGVPTPLIWPRLTVTVLEPPVARIMEKFGLTLKDLEDFDAVRRRILLELHGHKEAFDEAAGTLEGSIEVLLTHVREIDSTLLRTVERGEASLEATVARLRRKSGDALAKQDDIYARQLARVERHLLPDGVPQERILSPFSFFLKFGIDNVVNAFLALPPEGDHTVRF